jgi:tetratricopeptide (TPR) repeat protein
VSADDLKRQGGVEHGPTAVAATATDETLADGATQAAAAATLPAAQRGPMLGAGTLIGRYRIEATLGAGGMGVVYRARDTELDRAVALKLVRPQGNAEELAQRLRRESRLQARAAHRSVITVFDIGRDGDQVFVAMELIEGATLSGWLAQATRPWREIVDVFSEAAHGLAAAHAAGLVHRDFKPDNVLVELRDGRVSRVLVSDFGVARALEDADGPAARPSLAQIGVTATGALVGTPAYMSPEQLDARPADERADVFSFCVALWEASFGERPFRGKTLAEIVTAFDTVPAPPARSSVPGWIVGVLRRGLAIDREQRVASMLELVEALDWRRRRRRRLLAGGTALAAVTALGVVVATRLMAPAPEVSACATPGVVDEQVIALGAQLAAIYTPSSPVLAEYWRSSAASYARGWRTLRATACAAWSEVQVRCVDELGAEDVAMLDAARIADPAARADLLRSLAGTVPPHECLSDAAAQVLRNMPQQPWHRPAAIAIERVAGMATNERAQFQAQVRIARQLADAAQFEPLRLHLEAIVVEERDTEDMAAVRLERQRLAQAADRAGEYRVAAMMYYNAVLGLADDGRLLLASDDALIRAGNPPLLRSWWFLMRGATQILAGKRDEAEVSLQRALSLRAAIDAPYSVGFDKEFANVLMRFARYGEAATRLHRAKDMSIAFGYAGPNLVRVRRELAKALAWSGQTEAANVELTDLLSRAAPGRALPDQELIGVIHLYVEIASWTDPAEALRRLALWESSLDATLERDSLWRGQIEAVRTTSLAMLERYAEAERSGRRALEILVQRLGAHAARTAEARMMLGQVLLELARTDEAEEQLALGISDMAAASGERNGRVAQVRFVLATLLTKKRRYAEARPLLEQALALYESSTEMMAYERGKVRWALATAIQHTAPEPARERALIEAAFADWGDSTDVEKADRVAARARLRELTK